MKHKVRESQSADDLLYLETRTPLSGKGSTLNIPYYGAMFEAGAVAPHYASEVLLVAANPTNEVIKEALSFLSEVF